jgi:hypothetical protein
MATQKRKPRDLNARAAAIIRDATNGDTLTPDVSDGRNPHAVALGRLGGLKGGKARAQKLSARKRSEIARRAAQARWQQKSSGG